MIGAWNLDNIDRLSTGVHFWRALYGIAPGFSMIAILGAALHTINHNTSEQQQASKFQMSL